MLLWDNVEHACLSFPPRRSQLQWRRWKIRPGVKLTISQCAPNSSQITSCRTPAVTSAPKLCCSLSLFLSRLRGCFSVSRANRSGRTRTPLPCHHDSALSCFSHLLTLHPRHQGQLDRAKAADACLAHFQHPLRAGLCLLCRVADLRVRWGMIEPHESSIPTPSLTARGGVSVGLDLCSTEASCFSGTHAHPPSTLACRLRAELYLGILGLVLLVVEVIIGIVAMLSFARSEAFR